MSNILALFNLIPMVIYLSIYLPRQISHRSHHFLKENPVVTFFFLLMIIPSPIRSCRYTYKYVHFFSIDITYMGTNMDTKRCINSTLSIDSFIFIHWLLKKLTMEWHQFLVWIEDSVIMMQSDGKFTILVDYMADAFTESYSKPWDYGKITWQMHSLNLNSKPWNYMIISSLQKFPQVQEGTLHGFIYQKWTIELHRIFSSKFPVGA